MNLIPVAFDPTNIAALAAMFPELANANEEATGGLFISQPPSIGLNGTRFVMKENGEGETLPTLEMACAIIAAKPEIEKAWFATKFTPGQEPKAPDCGSSNGVTPDANTPLKQADSCAGCPKNQFGTSTNPDGTPGKGKACTDSKILALYVNGGVYRFKIPPASLQAFSAYVKQLSGRGIALPLCVTTIGFNPAFSFPVLTFTFAGMLSPEQGAIILEKRNSPETKEIIGVKTFALPAPVAPVAPVAPIAPVVENEQWRSQIIGVPPVAPIVTMPVQPIPVAPVVAAVQNVAAMPAPGLVVATQTVATMANLDQATIMATPPVQPVPVAPDVLTTDEAALAAALGL